MVARLGSRHLLRVAVTAAALAALATWAPRLALGLAVLLSVAWVARHDDRLGTWGALYVLALVILAVLTLLVAGLAFIHAAVGG